jgi:predicted nucleic acid-binding protein
MVGTVSASGAWVAGRLGDAELLAPHLVLFEATNALRGLERAGGLSADAAALAHADLLSLDLVLWPYEVLARQVWALRHQVSVFDAAYVAVAVQAGATLVTLDRRLAAAPGLPCEVVTPPA